MQSNSFQRLSSTTESFVSIGILATKRAEKKEEEPADNKEEMISEVKKTQKGHGKSQPSTITDREVKEEKEEKGEKEEKEAKEMTDTTVPSATSVIEQERGTMETGTGNTTEGIVSKREAGLPKRLHDSSKKIIEAWL